MTRVANLAFGTSDKARSQKSTAGDYLDNFQAITILELLPRKLRRSNGRSVVLDDHREQFALVGAMTLLGAAVFLSLTFLGG